MIKRLDTVPIRPNPTESKRRVDIKLIQSVNPDEEDPPMHF